MSPGADPFDDPVDDPISKTIIVPRPGGRFDPQPEKAAAPPVATVDATSAPRRMEASREPLVRAAAPIMLAAEKLRRAVANDEPARLRDGLAQNVRDFAAEARTLGADDRAIQAAQYILCTMVDEAALSTPWGASFGWDKRSLLLEFFNDAAGGEKVFALLDRAKAAPGANAGLLELGYFALSLGFRGRYALRPAGEFDVYRDGLYQAIRLQMRPPEPELSPHWRGVGEGVESRLMRAAPLWGVALAAAGAILFAYVAFSLSMGKARAPVERAAAAIGQTPIEILRSAPPPPPPEPGFDLAAALAPHLGRALTFCVDQRDGVEFGVVTVEGMSPAGVLFPRGSAVVSDALAPAVARIGAALAELRLGGAAGGQIVVLGHTDATGKVGSNRVLSERRAEAVASLLEEAGAPEGSTLTRGLGSSTPRTPERTEADRSRNRRVDVVFRLSEDVEAPRAACGATL